MLNVSVVNFKWNNGLYNYVKLKFNEIYKWKLWILNNKIQFISIKIKKPKKITWY